MSAAIHEASDRILETNIKRINVRGVWYDVNGPVHLDAYGEYACFHTSGGVPISIRRSRIDVIEYLETQFKASEYVK